MKGLWRHGTIRSEFDGFLGLKAGEKVAWKRTYLQLSDGSRRDFAVGTTYVLLTKTQMLRMAESCAGPNLQNVVGKSAELCTEDQGNRLDSMLKTHAEIMRRENRFTAIFKTPKTSNSELLVNM